MRAVLRLTVNARVSLLDPAGVEHRGVIDRYERDRAVIRIESSLSLPSLARPRIILAAAIIKGPRMDFLVEKAAELGASELWPLVCARGLVRSPGAERLARWKRLALSAAKQSQSAAAMEVRAPLAFDDLLHRVPPGALATLCAQAGAPLVNVIRRAHPSAILIAIGPEGDFDDDERARAANAGFVAAGLGPNRLRSETAALGAVSIAAGLLYDEQGSSDEDA
jgi:16S rRNA (uracil1498-N3)-methyltransferase